MKNWTTQAEQRLTEYLRERTDREGFHGEDAVELKEDLRSHIHEEAEQADGEVIGLMHLESILGRLDAGYRPVAEAGIKRPAVIVGKFRKFLAWTLGVVLPLGILVFEMISSFCGSVFFDPVPTYWHAAWIAVVPAVNAWLLRGGRGAKEKAHGVAAGFSLVTALFYGLLFLPLIHYSIVALIFFGLGMLSLTPVLTAFATWRIGRAARREAQDLKGHQSGWWTGVFASLVVLAALEGPAMWTRANLTEAVAGSGRSEAAVSRLRLWHSERVLLKACYEGNRGTRIATDISGWILTGWRIPLAIIDEETLKSFDSDTVREVFFRVTGKPFNSLKPPANRRSGGLSGRMDPLDEVDFDDHVGGDEVAVRIKHLDLAESRFDGHVDAVSRIGYGEWTMVFRNDSRLAREARCQVRLPRDGRVSRLSLWVNGEPREAAFSTVSKVKAAYQSVAVAQHRDPVLVNVVGPDTVMVQCFPVPPRGEMKIRFGVTAPLDNGRWEMPRIVERNFGTSGSLQHAVWLQGDCMFDLTGAGKTTAANADGAGYSLPVTYGGGAAAGASIVLNARALPAEASVVWCEDRFAKPEERYLIREPVRITRQAAGKLVVVIDGSLSLAGAKDWITKSIGTVGESALCLVLADDHARRVTLRELETYHFSGGRDNEAALREGIRLSKETGGPIVWIHGPQAIRLSHSESLLQLLERGSVRPVIHEVDAVAGPNRLAESIYRTGCLRRGPGLAMPAEDFTGFLTSLRREHQEDGWNWKRAASSGGLPGRQVWDQLARSWAASSVEDSAAIMTDAARAELAARYQMVTPFSGAVVLENQQQYDDNGLAAADGDATPHIPNVPEPSVSLLMMFSAAAALLRRKRATDQPSGNTGA